RLKLKLDFDFNGESYQTVSGQNSNNSIRLSDEFMQAVKEDRDNDQRGREHVVICVARKDGEDAATEAAEAERQRDQRRA
ncbi:MAG: hypothetical protein EB140_05915, partial [Proteobacteria bacterium]|nr:hypothetical protein [Pseudomonadota bacterium]